MYKGPGEIQYERIPDATLPNQRAAIVKTTLCSICGSDLHPYHVDMGVHDYCIGHEAVGEVIEVGSDVSKFKVGDRVLVCATAGCGQCKPCLSGHVILCENSDHLLAFGQGIPDFGGCQAEAVSVPAADTNMWHLPEEFSDELGIMLADNMSTAWYCARRAKIQPGDKVAVIGLGSVGMLCVLSALAMGAEAVYAIDLLADRRAEAAKLGAIPIDNPDAVEAVMELSGGVGVDACLDACGGPVTTPMAVRLAKRGGRVSIVGVSEQPDIAFPVLDAQFKNVEVYTGVVSVPAELPSLMEALKTNRLNAREITAPITHHMKLSEGAKAYELFDKRPQGLHKIVLDPTE